MRMDRLNSHFLCPLQLAPSVVSGDGQSALVDKLGVSLSQSRLLTGTHRLSSGDSTAGLGPQCWDSSLTPSQQPVSSHLRCSREYNCGQDAITIAIKTCGHKKTHYTAVLACVNGTKLPPMLIFKRKTMTDVKIPQGIVVHIQEKGLIYGWKRDETCGWKKFGQSIQVTCESQPF
jgi:hypothetical protein